MQQWNQVRPRPWRDPASPPLANDAKKGGSTSRVCAPNLARVLSCSMKSPPPPEAANARNALSLDGRQTPLPGEDLLARLLRSNA
jgi:hypothetical protein